MLEFAAEIEKETAVGGAGGSARNKVSAFTEGTVEIVGVGLSEVVAIVENRAAGAERAGVEGVELSRGVSGCIDVFFAGEFVMKRFDERVRLRTDAWIRAGATCEGFVDFAEQTGAFLAGPWAFALHCAREKAQSGKTIEGVVDPAVDGDVDGAGKLRWTGFVCVKHGAESRPGTAAELRVVMSAIDIFGNHPAERAAD